MKIFDCQACGQPLTFENALCDSCGRRLGYAADLREVTALEHEGTAWRALAAPARRYRFCVNAIHDACNWLIPDEAPDPYCTACRHNHIVPDLGIAWNLTRWRQLEMAKHRLFYSLMRLNLPLSTRAADPQGLAFDFLVDPTETAIAGPPVLTGHDNGLITINLAEADDVERERRRKLFGEHYRTLLGHFRHEIGHYFWNVLVRNDPSLEAFRAPFGDERADYGSSLRTYYANGPILDWQNRHVSAYASAHPWEDWAETWAHYLHIIDTLETAGEFGLRIRPRRQTSGLAATIDFDPHRVRELDRLIEAWLPLTYAVNSLNRSMGQPDLYPFMLSPTIIGKLAFIHDRVQAVTAALDEETAGLGTLKAVIAGLRNPVAAPNA